MSDDVAWMLLGAAVTILLYALIEEWRWWRKWRRQAERLRKAGL